VDSPKSIDGLAIKMVVATESLGMENDGGKGGLVGCFIDD
jgi:hypothetical protein